MTREKERRVQICSGAFFALYLAVLFYLLFFAEGYGRTAGGEMRYNLHPGREILRFLTHVDTLGVRSVFLNVYGNLLGFLPFGLFLPLLHRTFRRFWRTTLTCMAFSGGVELAQLLARRGSCDIDDLILNTAGGMAGYVLFRLAGHARKRAGNTKTKRTKQ